MQHQISGLAFLSISIFIVYLGSKITNLIPVLKAYNIPPAVTSGLLVSLILTLLSQTEAPLFQITFDLSIRNLFLLSFFSCVGLSAKLTTLKQGGKTLFTLLIVLTVFIFFQNLIGVLTSLLLGLHPIHGLLAGSISFAGGHGTAITWGQHLNSLGYTDITEFTLMAATLGLILGGLMGGPICQMLINKKNLIPQDNKLKNTQTNSALQSANQSDQNYLVLDIPEIFKLLFSISTTIVIGLEINSLLHKLNILLPDFLIVLILGILLNNFLDFTKHSLNTKFTTLISDVSLDLFVVMSLFTLNLANLFNIALPLLVISLAQCLFVAFFAYYVFFRYAGKDYDAAVMTSGFVGSGLGATPVGMANVEAITHRFLPSPKAMLFVPLLGSVFTDLINSVILQSFIKIPLIGTP